MFGQHKPGLALSGRKRVPATRTRERRWEDGDPMPTRTRLTDGANPS